MLLNRLNGLPYFSRVSIKMECLGSLYGVLEEDNKHLKTRLGLSQQLN